MKPRDETPTSGREMQMEDAGNTGAVDNSTWRPAQHVGFLPAQQTPGQQLQSLFPACETAGLRPGRIRA